MKVTKKSGLFFYYFITPLAALIYVLCCIISLLPPSEVIILSGPPGGFFSTTSEKIKSSLNKANIRARIKHVENTKTILTEVNSASSDRPHIGFVAQDISKDSTEGLFSLGKIATEPLWLFSLKSSEIKSINDLLGKIIAVGPKDSGVRELSERILSLHGVNKHNSIFVEAQIVQAQDKLNRNEVDAAFFLLPFTSTVVKELALNETFHLIGFKEAEALSHKINFLEKVVVPKGAFSISPRNPKNDVTTVAVPVSVIAGDHAGIGLSAFVANILKTEFTEETCFVQDRTLPTFVYKKLRPLPAAKEIYANGLPFISDVFGVKLGLILTHAAKPLLVTIGVLVLLLGIIITYTEVIPVLFQVRELFVDDGKQTELVSSPPTNSKHPAKHS